MMVNPDVDGCAKTLNHRKIIRQTQKNKLLKTNTKTEKSLKVAARFSHLDCQERHFAPLPPASYVSSYDILFLHTVSFSYSTATRYEMMA